MEIEHACPQCGAPVILAETDRLLSCPFCRVRLFLWSTEVFRYLLPPAPAAAARSDLVYVPYVRFRGMVFDLEQPQEHERVLDTSFLATPTGPFPASLGFRPQALRLRPAAFREEDRCLAFCGDDRIRRCRPTPGRTSERPPGKIRPATKSVGEVRSLIYAPFYPDQGRWHDGVLEEPLPNAPVGPPLQEFSWEKRKTWDLHFIATLCPECGRDLEGVNESCLLFCPQCRTGWEPSRQGLCPFPVYRQAFSGEEEAFSFLPFWYFKLPYHPSETFRFPVSELLELQPGKVPPWEAESGRTVFWIPAFKISPRIFLRLGWAATQDPFSETELEPLLPSRFHPVTLPAEEARECIDVLEACLDRDAIILEATRTPIPPGDWEKKLVFIPFEETAYELIQPRTRMGISRNILNLAKYI